MNDLGPMIIQQLSLIVLSVSPLPHVSRGTNEVAPQYRVIMAFDLRRQRAKCFSFDGTLSLAKKVRLISTRFVSISRIPISLGRLNAENGRTFIVSFIGKERKDFNLKTFVREVNFKQKRDKPSGIPRTFF